MAKTKKTDVDIVGEVIENDAVGTKSANNEQVSEKAALIEELNRLKTEKCELEVKLAACKAHDEVEAERQRRVRPYTDITPESDGDYVEVKLFCDGEYYRDDMIVGINGTICRIKRGVPVKIKRAFARIINESENLSAKTYAALLCRDGRFVNLNSGE